MTNHFDQPEDDKSRSRTVDSAVAALRSRLTGRDSQPTAPRSATGAPRDGWFVWPMIKPSTRQRVATDVHRQDWP